MSAVAATPATLAAAVPRIVEPAPYQASYGRLVAEVPGGTERIVVLVDGRRFAARTARSRRVTIRLSLPMRDVQLRVLAIDANGKPARSASVGPVFGLPPTARPRFAASVQDAKLQRRVSALVRAFPGTAAAFVQDLVTGAGAAWNAKARFPAGSTLKLAIAVEALRSLRGPPSRGSELDSLFRAMLIRSDNMAANRLEVAFGGSTSGGSARVNAMMRSLGLVDSEMYGGYETEGGESRRQIPVEVESQPAIAGGKYTTAADLARLLRAVHLAAGARGPLITRFGGAFSPAEARYLLYLLLHVEDSGKLDRFLPRGTAVAHKAGWISTARHDAGLVFWYGGAYVAAVMTYGRGVGTASDVLAGRVARAALSRVKTLG
jgi:beta-lactamase class A